MIRRLAVLLTAAALAAPVAPAYAERSERAPVQREPASVTISTWGNGHGKGLSQYGARNRADAGESYGQILDHYYPGTSQGSARGSIRVLLSAAPGGRMTIQARSGVKARAGTRTWTLPTRRDGKSVKLWRVRRAGERWELAYRTGSWHVWRTTRVAAAFASRQPMALVKAATYRGVLRLTPSGVVNTVGLENYVRGVVAQEMPASWSPAAVQAQAVAARTYAVFERGNVAAGRDYDLCDTSACQVYLGAAGEHPASDAAVAATAGEVRSYGGEPIFAQFSASNGGYSVDGGYPYLVAAPDDQDHGYPGDPASRTFTGDEITRHWTGLGDLVSVEVLERDGNGTAQVPGGRATLLRVTGTKGEVDVSGSAFRSYLGLRTTLLEIT
ncbi:MULTISPECIES: SpoIID/LytB domain-containing protein [unclassified Nocardioides]|uniref:SpoIID/LytB domain-containing protein n=1 Tax=unclassified Nocardioides TaxID=2615069 RepID=UPI000056FE2C|nr:MULTISPECIES: SpoIID/LytB domain-containing protein [unclassified Nocardioides]ABL83016.1 SpoIID/LytB domain [Nocardioides sp. JS614]